MAADPGQTKNIAAEKPELTNELTYAVDAWRKELFGNDAAPQKGKNKPAAMEARPFTVGYTEFPRTPLPARDGIPHGGVKRSGSAPNSSYFVNWTSKDDSMTWDIEVHTTGDYVVEIPYTCPEGDAGSIIELSFNDSKLTGKVGPAWNPPLYTNQDTLPRPPGESTMKEFRSLKLGEIRLLKGVFPLRLRALEIPGQSVMDVRRLTLKLLPDPK